MGTIVVPEELLTHTLAIQAKPLRYLLCSLVYNARMEPEVKERKETKP